MQDRVEALERAVRQLAKHAVGQATTTVAQGIICRVVADLLACGGTSLDDVRDLAVAAAERMNADVVVAVRTLLAEAPAGTGRVQ